MVARYIPALMALGAILAAYKIFDLDELFAELTKKDLAEKYDYIIVGGGTSGAVLASRLTEDPKKSVLLLEAGGTPSGQDYIDIPIFADKVRGSEFDWNYKTVPQKYSCKAHNDRISMWPSGKGLGGTSNLNYLLYLRGSRHDYDGWVNDGATGWGFKDVLPYFIKSEDNRNPEYTRTVFHGFGGRLTVQDIRLSPANLVAQMAFAELGVKKRDINGRNHFGYSSVQATIRRGVRWSTYRAFLLRATDRPNLHVLTHAAAQKILFEGRKASGVVFKHEGKQKIVRANKEVILSAGTVGTAKLLLLSGVGPKAHLKDVKVPLVADIPVGENLQDHVMADGIEFFTPYSGMSITSARGENFMSSWAYTLFGTGMKMSPRFREAIAYLKVRNQPPQFKFPLIALHIVANVEAYEASQLNVKEETWKSLHNKPPSKEGFTVFPVLLHPRSKGTLRLASNNPDDDALIDPNYLKEDVDVKMLTEAYQYARKLINTKAIGDWDMSVTNDQIPECAKYGNFTNAYVECFLRHITLSGYAPVGTCRIGAAGDPTAVVDPFLRVRGVKNLRVVDASIIPGAISGNTYATQIMIAEKAADIIGEVDTVKGIKDYFKHLIQTKHKKIVEDEDIPTTAAAGDDKKR